MLASYSFEVSKEMKRIILATLIIAIVAISARNSYACWCSIPSVPEAVERADAVFVGEVADVIPPRTSDPDAPLPGRFFTIKFKIEKSWKGVDSDEIDVLSAQGNYSCFAFPPVYKGEKYLVYADPVYHDGSYQKGWHFISVCNRTALVPVPGWEIRDVDRFRGSDFNRSL